MNKFIKKKSLSLYFIIISFGTLTVFFQINYDDLWLDEMSSFYIADPNLSLDQTLFRHRKFDWHNPPLFNLVLKEFFKITDYNPDYARYISFLFGVLAMSFFGILSYQIKKDNSFILSTLLACISIYIIKYSQELRPYSLLLLLSIINIYLYYKVINEFLQKNSSIIFLLFFFVMISLLNYSTNPFALIILFSQISNSLIRLLFFNKKDKLFFVSLIFILVLYLLTNYNYILYQISFTNYMLSADITNVIDGFYFPRFFGSKIMGYTYLLILVFLILYNQKKIFSDKNNYLLLLIVLLYSYLIPFIYGLLRTPVLHDRYIIFVLVPILILVSCLSTEISSKKIKNFIISLILILTLSNHYFEIFNRKINKPEFKEMIKYIKTKNIEKNIIFYDNTETSIFVFNYLKNLTPTMQSDFNLFQFNNNLPKDLKTFWLICYTPRVNFNCNLSDTKNLELIDEEKKYLIEAKLYKFN